jgi:hypothetical protein
LEVVDIRDVELVEVADIQVGVQDEVVVEVADR